MIRIDTTAAAIARRIAAHTGRRASEIYPFADHLLAFGVSEADAEDSLQKLCECGPEFSLVQLLEMAFGPRT